MPAALAWPAARACAAQAEQRLTQVADGLFVIVGQHDLMNSSNAGAICNISIIIGSEAVAVVDSGGSVIEAQGVIAAIRALTAKPIRYLINTHMHPDHVFGNAAFRDIGARIVGHRNLPRALAGRAEVYLSRFKQSMGQKVMAGVEIVLPTELVDGTLELDLGGRKLELRAWDPAHTDNDLTIHDRQTSTLIAGDLVFLEHIPTLDGSLLGWMRQLQQLAAIAAARVIPGHGPASSDWPAALEPEKAYFDVLIAETREAIVAGQTLAEATASVARSERGHWQLFDEHHERNVIAAFAELEWE